MAHWSDFGECLSYHRGQVAYDEWSWIDEFVNVSIINVFLDIVESFLIILAFFVERVHLFLTLFFFSVIFEIEVVGRNGLSHWQLNRFILFILDVELDMLIEEIA